VVARKRAIARKAVPKKRAKVKKTPVPRKRKAGIFAIEMRQITRRRRVIERFLENKKTHEIAAAEGVCTETIERDLRWMRDDQLSRMRLSQDESRGIEADKLDKIESAAWESWKMSKRNGHPEGNPQFLALIERAVGRRMQLLGLDVHQEEGGSAFDPKIQIVEIVVKSPKEVERILQWREVEQKVNQTIDVTL